MRYGARSAFGLLTIIGGSAPPGPGAVAWFAPVGVVLGTVVGVTWVGANEVWPPAVAAAVVIAVDLVLTGLLHVDGLADAADGLLPPLDRSRRLEVMRTPEIGAFGVAAVGAVLLGRWAAVASQPDDALLIIGLWASARGAMGVALATVRPARPTGMAAEFGGGSPIGAAAGAGGGLAIAALGAGIWGMAAAAAVLVTVAAVVEGGRRRVGGITGDVLGAACVVGETVGLVVAAAQ